jgi:hypothetical protein
MTWEYVVCYIGFFIVGGWLIMLLLRMLFTFGDDGITDYSRWYDDDGYELREMPQVEQPEIEIERPSIVPQPAVVEEQPTPHSLFWRQAAQKSERSRR